MAKIRRIDFSPDEFLVGVADLKHDEIGPYWVACSLMYSRGGPIPDDDSWIARACGCHVRTWRAIKVRLATIGKLTLKDGMISNERCLKEIERAEGRVKKSRDASDESVKARRERSENSRQSSEYNDIPEAPAPFSDELTTNDQPSTINHQPPQGRTEAAYSVAPRVEAEAPKAAPADDGLDFPAGLRRVVGSVTYADTDEAFAEWSSVAGELGIPDAGFLNGDRRKALAVCLAECGKDRWKLAMAELRVAEWLRDDHDPSKPKRWVNLMNIIKPENFMGLLEKRYADRHSDDKQSNLSDNLKALAEFGRTGTG